MAHGFDPPKALLVVVGVTVLAALSRARGEAWGTAAAGDEDSGLESFTFLGSARTVPRGVHEFGASIGDEGETRRALGAAAILAAILTTATLLASDRWTSILGGEHRRQGWLTEVAELGVFVAAVLATRQGLITGSGLTRWITFAGGCVAFAALCQSWRFEGLLGERIDSIEWAAEVKNRVVGPIGNPSQLSTYLAVVVPIAAAAAILALRRRSARSGVFAALALGSLFVALLYARGRSGSFGAIAGLGVLALALPVAARWARVVKGVAIAGVTALVVLVALVNVPSLGLRERLEEGVEGGGAAHWLRRVGRLVDPESETVRIRLLIADATSSALASHPSAWVVGFGPDGAWPALAEGDSPERREIESLAAPPDRPHAIVGEKILAAGAGAALLWLGILASAIALAWREAGLVRRAAPLAAAMLTTAAAAFLGVSWFAPHPGLASAAAAGAAVLPAVVVAGMCGLRRASEVGTGRERTLVAVALGSALVAHLVACSVSVTSVSERVLVWAIAGVAIASAAVPSTDDASRESAPASHGLWVGGAISVLLPVYLYYWFGWEPAKRVLAIGVVPVFVLLLGALSAPTGAARASIVAGAVAALAFTIAIVCASTAGKPGPEALWEHGGMSAVTPLLLATALGAGVAGTILQARRGASAGDPRPRWRLAPSTIGLGAAALLLVWIAAAELRSDTTRAASSLLGRAALELQRAGRSAGRTDLEAQAQRRQQESLALLQRARLVGAPLGFLGAPAVLDRVLESERP